MRESVTLDEAVEFLNGLLALDRPAMAALLLNRVPCGEGLARHPTVQVMRRNGFQVGLLGVLNGLFGTDENGRGSITLRLKEGEIVAVERRAEEIIMAEQQNWRDEDGEG
jgi:hypothetical protein